MPSRNTALVFQGFRAHDLNCTSNGGIFLGRQLIASITKKGDVVNIAVEGDTTVADPYNVSRRFGRGMYSVHASCAIVVTRDDRDKPVLNFFPEPQMID